MIDESTYNCDDCGRIFESVRERNAHRRSDHPKYRKSRQLTDEEAAAIRERLPVEPPWPTEAEYEMIASEFNINWMTVANIAMGTSYRRVKACPPGHPLRLELNAENAAKERIRYLGRKHRKAVGDAQGWLCTYCKRDISGPRRASLDHIIPIERNGTSDRDNLQMLCFRCNQSKNNRTHDEYVAILQRSAQRQGESIPALIKKREAEARFLHCPCHHYGCPPGCSGCYMCGHEPNAPESLVCPNDEYGGVTPCGTPTKCREKCAKETAHTQSQ